MNEDGFKKSLTKNKQDLDLKYDLKQLLEKPRGLESHQNYGKLKLGGSLFSIFLLCFGLYVMNTQGVNKFNEESLLQGVNAENIEAVDSFYAASTLTDVDDIAVSDFEADFY